MAERYVVLSQVQSQQLSPAGTVEDVMEVTAQTASGVIFTERVPLSVYTPENVAALLDARAEDIERVQAL